MIYGLLVSILFMLAVAYVVIVLANKEEGNMKLAGQLIASLIVIVALVVLVYGASGKGCPMGGKMGGMGGGMMMDKDSMKCKMMDMMKKDPSMMKEMMKDKDMKTMMQKNMKSMSK
jgi:hypothetical protein